MIMGKKDTLTKEYMADNHIFADVFNYFMFHGEQIIKAENLKELNSAELTVLYDMNGKLLPIQRDRDVLKIASMKYDDTAVYLLFAKYSEDKTQLAKLLENDEGFKHLDRKTAQVISVLTNSDFKVEESEGEDKVCIAWEGIKEDFRAEGEEIARKAMAVSMLKSKLLSYEQISELTKIPVTELKNLELAG